MFLIIVVRYCQINVNDENSPIYSMVLCCTLYLLHAGWVLAVLHRREVREYGRAGRVAAHHGVSGVHVAGAREGVELHRQNVGVRTPGASPLTTLVAVWWVCERTERVGNRR